MANPFQQRVLLRKRIYAALILVLFTGSLVHRKWSVEPQAEELQLRETSRGEVELTSSAVRLTLTGSRGLAVTLLWAAVDKEQTRHKWNEVELLVGSITKLQPYFIKPWLFQGWNLAFNVAVECDKPRDKYYYVSRGLQLLAEGERRNQGKIEADTGQQRFPGNPDLRNFLGFTYQLKIGQSDEKNAMQCLFDMSCIDPVDRNPELLRGPGEHGDDVNYKLFEEFCLNHPRLVRRLSEQLEYNTPRQVVGFLHDNRVLPTRFSEIKLENGKSQLAEARQQFPILPPQLRDSWPNPSTRELSREALTIFLMCRTWYSYAQLPLPPAFANPGAELPPFDPIRHRLPQMSIILFRSHPSRAQAHIAENLQEEGWFDLDGWLIPEWFDRVKGSTQEVRVGKDPKYHSGAAWEEAYRMYKDYGKQNGLYLDALQRQELEKSAQLFRKEKGVNPGDKMDLRADQRTGAMGQSYFAHQKLAWHDTYRQRANYDDHLYEAEAERYAQTVLARKLIFQAKKLARSGAPPQALAYYQQALPLLLNVLLENPNFRRIISVQEEAYEAELKYVRLLQDEKASLLRPLTMRLAQLSAWPYPPWNQELTASQKKSIIPIRNFRGPFDQVLVYDIPEEREVKKVLLLWTQATGLPLTQLCTGLPLPLLVLPGKQNLMLTTTTTLDPVASPNSAWRPLIESQAMATVRNRVGLIRKQKFVPPEGMQMPAGMQMPP